MHIYLGLFASVIGLWASSYIYRKKHAQSKLFCPLRTACDEVVNSMHSRSFGIPNEVLGILYYVLTSFIFIAALHFEFLFVPWVQLGLLLLTSFGLLFSFYLVSLQALVIRAWCMWCLMSAFANVLLVVSLFGFQHEGVFVLLKETKLWWVILHNIGFILGLGGATITDVFFFKFLKDMVITEGEKETMDTLSSIIWVGIGILVISGVLLYLPEQSRLDVSSKFLLKLVVVSVVVINGILLNLLVAPKLHTLSFARTPVARSFRRIAFALGGISIVSWYSAFLLGSLRSIPISFPLGLAIYGAILLLVIIGSQLYERIVTRNIQ